jgi:sporulation protein YlmC with PRC-barrel domain
MMRITDLEGKHVKTKSGKSLGYVYEIHALNNEVTILVCGARGLLQRMFRSRRSGHRIEWSRVARLAKDAIELKD